MDGWMERKRQTKERNEKKEEMMWMEE